MNRRPRILIVEDDTPLAMMMVSLLTRAGCDVQTAWNAEKAMRLAQDEGFDLITLDVDLSGITGFEICSRLKANPRLCDTPLIFISGRPHEEDMRRGLELGAADYITKPFDTLGLASRLLSHIKIKNNSNSVEVMA
jgi:DNA-binding response OmpR family regulator